MTEGEPLVHDVGALERVTVVLDQPKDLVNVAAVLRVMMNMGLDSLRLVKPPPLDPIRVEGIAHRSGELLEAATLHDSLDDAIADAVYVVGTSARARTAQQNYTTPRDVAPKIVERARQGPVAIVFGREDRGLTNRALDRCQSVAVIPTHPDYPSLNLAQACLVLCYEVFLASGGADRPHPTGRRATGPAASEDLESMYAALEDGLQRIEFFKSRHPRTVLRTLRTALARADLNLREARLIRAVGFEIGHYLDRQEGPPDPREGPPDPREGPPE